MKIIVRAELRLTGKLTLRDICPTLKAGTKKGDSEPLVLITKEDMIIDTKQQGPPRS